MTLTLVLNSLHTCYTDICYLGISGHLQKWKVAITHDDCMHSTSFGYVVTFEKQKYVGFGNPAVSSRQWVFSTTGRLPQANNIFSAVVQVQAKS